MIAELVEIDAPGRAAIAIESAMTGPEDTGPGGRRQPEASGVPPG